MTAKFYDRLSNDLIQLLQNPIDYNVTIEVGEAPDNQIFEVHSYILQTRCSYFKKKFNETSFNENNVKYLMSLSSIYGGTISLEKLENSIIFDLLTSSHELDLDELVEYLQTHLVNTNNASWLKLNFAQVYQTCYQAKNLVIIQKFCNNIIAKHPNTIFKSEKFISLPEDALISIIKLDDLQLDEDKIWDYVIQWGKSKNLTLPSNPDEWTSDDFIALKTTLKNCLPHVRYFNMSSEKVLEKLWPYLQLFEPKLWLEINTKLLTPEKQISSTILPPRKILSATLPTRTTPIPSLPSAIITNEHALELSSWIDRKETTYTENNPYEFKLLVRGSRDGEKVLEKLWPYLQLFEPKLWLEINTKLLTPEKLISSIILPPRKILSATLPTRTTPIPSLPSAIITNEHALELSSWIDRKETTYTENNPYEFKLLVRGSRDGFDLKTIYNICDQVSNTVIVAKVEDTGEIIGGYNPLEIHNNETKFYFSKDSFIFSLKTENLKNSIISRVTVFDFAIYYHSHTNNPYLQFGNALNLGGDLKTKMSNCESYFYEKSIRSNSNGFSVEEFEVFKVSPKK
ncbi:hypothetical protein Glove_275g67 [Diversispora epigaea]|uniref:TLDc domain-containing protein n=1 Tax=Diversispora epigaea TaxID=1348612 RepID=A0A397IBE0_9GLOM|nr:hypothetical protein Glove_275g67 [Diversispora epigaea]